MEWRGLLVSVRDAAEAEEAIAGGAAIVDVKDPDAGALGAASPEAIVRVAGVVGDRDWTIAGGELAEGSAGALGADRVVALVRRVVDASPRPPRLVKAGMARMAGSDWRGAMERVMSRLPSGVGYVAVAYADGDRAEAPDPFAVIAAARAIGCAGVLVDTFDKSGPGLFGAAGGGRVRRWVAAAHAAGLPIAVAGRLSLDEIAAAVATGGDVVAVRSAACVAAGRPGTPDGDRRGRVDRARVEEAVERLRRSGGGGR